MARLPLDPRISRIIIESMTLGSVREIVILAAALSGQDPRVRPPDKEHKADEAHRHFLDKRSDFLTGSIDGGACSPARAGTLCCNQNHGWKDHHDGVLFALERTYARDANGQDKAKAHWPSKMLSGITLRLQSCGIRYVILEKLRI